MKIKGSEGGFFRVVDENEDIYIAQQLFVDRNPKSRIIADLKKAIEHLIVERKGLFHNLPYIHFEGIKQVGGEYCLLRKGSDIYRPLYQYIKENEVPLETVKDWVITIAEIALEAKKFGIVWQGITLNSLWISADDKL